MTEQVYLDADLSDGLFLAREVLVLLADDEGLDELFRRLCVHSQGISEGLQLLRLLEEGLLQTLAARVEAFCKQPGLISLFALERPLPVETLKKKETNL